MKAVLVLLSIAGILPISAQVTPSTPTEFMKRGLGEGGSGGTASVGVSERTPQVRKITYTAISPLRGWTNTGGKMIQAQLLAFSGPEPGVPGPVEVIRDGKVRLLVPGSKGPVEYPMEKLREADRIEIERIAKAAAKGPPRSSSQPNESDADD
tara:strand:+ start:2633 stop:3091 length:459 start_codon:yes stop_codon:yes gene_type:complete